jgi:hypothetical protein
MNYRPGAVKQDPATRAVALRTIAASDDDAWAVVTVGHAAHYGSRSVVHSARSRAAWPRDALIFVPSFLTALHRQCAHCTFS